VRRIAAGILSDLAKAPDADATAIDTLNALRSNLRSPDRQVRRLAAEALEQHGACPAEDELPWRLAALERWDDLEAAGAAIAAEPLQFALLTGCADAAMPLARLAGAAAVELLSQATCDEARVFLPAPAALLSRPTVTEQPFHVRLAAARALLWLFRRGSLDPVTRHSIISMRHRLAVPHIVTTVTRFDMDIAVDVGIGVIL